MKDRVVCVASGKSEVCPLPELNDIYHVVNLYTGKISDDVVKSFYVKDWYVLKEFGNDYAFSPELFRPVDTTYGPAICETIEQQIELEKVLI